MQLGRPSRRGFSLDDVDAHLASEHSVVWVDQFTPSREELQVVADELSVALYLAFKRRDWL